MYKPMESSSNLSPSSTISTSSSSSSSSSCSSTPANIPVSSQQRRQQQLQLHHYVQQQQRLFSRHQQNISSRAATGSSNVMKSSSPKLIPRNFFDCSTSDIIILVSSMFQELVVLNDALPFDAHNLTRFHSRSQPPITIVDYLVRITKFCSLEKSIILAMIYYIDLLCTTFKTFNINSLTVHRFLITSAMVASKGLCDTFCTNTHYAKVGGLSCMELNSLEVEFLIRVDYRIVPPADRLNQYFERMVKRMSNKYQFQDTIPKSTSLNSMTEGQNNDNTQTQSKIFASPASTNINLAAANITTTTRINADSVSSPKQNYSINTDTTLPLRTTKKETHHQPPNHAEHEGIVLASDVSVREGRTSLSSKLKRPSAAQEEHDIDHKTNETNNEPNNQKDQNPSVSYSSRHGRTPSKIRIEEPVNIKPTNGNQNTDDNTGINANIPNNTCDENKNHKPVKNSKALSISSLNNLTPDELQQVQLQLQKRLANPGQNDGGQSSSSQQPVKFHNPFKTNNGNEAEMMDDDDDDGDGDDDDSGLYDDELA